MQQEDNKCMGSAVDHICRRHEQAAERQLHKDSTHRVPQSGPVSSKLAKVVLQARGTANCQVLALVFVPVAAH